MKMFTFKKDKVPDWSFQREAVSSLVNDFKNKEFGRFLLVLPTGGGKTITALKVISRMIDLGIIPKNKRILWIVHTLSLYRQAKNNLTDDSNYLKFSLNINLPLVVDVKMKSDASRCIKDNNYKIIIIDEAHHSAANTYKDFFTYPVGILGLTATPNRTDRRELLFDKVSYSITFRELVLRNVILLPKFLPELKTNIIINSTSLKEDNQLENFNIEKRNQLISNYIFTEAKKYGFKKVIVFVGTNSHVKSLYEVIGKNNKLLKNKFNHVGYIFSGNNNEKLISNEKYLEWHHSQSSSVLINCKILNEGYDDPAIDAVVMATPTNSILYYMQCVGRVVRASKNNFNNRAYVIDVVDRLPNISYRIDNRWLFAEISDYLEPLIEDVKVPWPISAFYIFYRLLILKANLSDLSIREIFSLICGEKINLIIFNDVPQNNFGKWRILSLSNEKKDRVRLFNDLSENIEEYYNKNHEYLFKQKYYSLLGESPINSRKYRSSMMAALYRAFSKKLKNEKVDSLIYLSFN